MKQALTVAMLLVALTLGGCRDWFHPTPPVDPKPDPNKPTQLYDVEWCLVSFEDANGGVEPVVESRLVDGMRPTIFFGRNGECKGNTGCNSYGGDYTVQGSAISFGMLIQTERACLDSYEGPFMTALSTAKSYEITADGTLRISYGGRPMNGTIVNGGVLNFKPCIEQ